MAPPSTKKVEAKVVVRGIIPPTILEREIREVDVNKNKYVKKDKKDKKDKKEKLEPLPPLIVLKEYLKLQNNYNNTTSESYRVLDDREIQHYNYEKRKNEIEEFARNYQNENLTKKSLLKDICSRPISNTEMRKLCVAILKHHNKGKYNIKITTQDISQYSVKM
tara:strand:+ start:2490 stop:2981 length:492 start_codon:yes stop_codon:yes gene_type:complete